MPALVTALLALALPAAPAAAQAAPPAISTGALVAAATSTGTVVTPASSTGPAIGAIRVGSVNVFDPLVPGEGIWPFRIANKIHFVTREYVIRRELLLEPGAPWDPLKALESERNLRSLGIFRKAEIRPAPRPDGTLDLDVRTQDSWTTNIVLGAGTEGGDAYYSYGAAEQNIGGYDKSASAIHSQNGPKRTNEFRYADKRFLGSRFALAPFYADTNHGDSVGTSVIRPFFSLETPYATGARWARAIDETTLYRDANKYSTFLQHTLTASAGFGLRLDRDRWFAQRLEAGWHEEKSRFDPTPETVPGTLPADRQMSGPTAGYSWVQPRYIKETDIDRMERIEDFNLGNELKVFGGFMGRATGSDRDRWIFNAMDQQGLYLMPGRFALSQVGISGRYSQDRLENAILFTNLNLFWKTTWPYPQTWVGHLEANRGRGLDGENQVVLGGNTGLRGYKNDSFVGGKSILLNVENRFFFPGEYFHLVRFGGVVFFDSGAVAPENRGIAFRGFKSDVGFGLRASSTRSQRGGVVRVDFAYALNQGPGGSRFVVAVQGGQAFRIFNSSTERVRQSPGSILQPEPE